MAWYQLMIMSIENINLAFELAINSLHNNNYCVCFSFIVELKKNYKKHSNFEDFKAKKSKKRDNVSESQINLEEDLKGEIAECLDKASNKLNELNSEFFIFIYFGAIKNLDVIFKTLEIIDVICLYNIPYPNISNQNVGYTANIVLVGALKKDIQKFKDSFVGSIIIDNKELVINCFVESVN